MAKFKKIGILTSGGDAPGMNAAIRAVTRHALSQGIEVVGVIGGYAGLLGAATETDKDVIAEKYLRPLKSGSVSKTITLGGTMLYSSRCPEFKTKEGMDLALKTCHEQNIDAIVAIGGDGTFRGATDLTNHGIPSIGIPATIDNDTTATDHTIGFDTALNTCLSMFDYLRDTSESHARCIVTEVMGNGCGYLALYAGIAAGAVTIAIPEIPYDYEYGLNKIRDARAKGKRGMIAVCCEKMAKEGEENVAEHLTKLISSETGVDSRFNRLGHIVRGGIPNLRDRLVASQMGVGAVSLLLEGKSNLVMCLRDNRVTHTDINFALVLDRMYKNKLKDGDLEPFTAAQVEEMKLRCTRRAENIRELYEISKSICY